MVDAELYANLAEEARVVRANKSLALRILDRGLKRFPKSGLIWDSIADTHRVFRSSPVEAEASYFAFRQADLASSDVRSELAWASYGSLLEKSEQFRHAEIAFRKAIELDPEYGWAMGQLSRLLRQKLANFSESERWAARYVELDPDASWPWFNLAYICKEHLRRSTDAEAAFRRAIEIRPDYFEAWAHLADMLAFTFERPIEAQEAFLKALSLKTDDPWTHIKYGHFLREFTDRFQESEEHLRLGVFYGPTYWGSWLGLGILYHEKLMKPSIAREYYAEAKRLGAPSEDINYRIARLIQATPSLRVIK